MNKKFKIFSPFPPILPFSLFTHFSEKKGKEEKEEVGKMRKYVILLIIALVVFSNSGYAKTNEKVGTCVGQFLKICAGARPAGMGEAFSAVADDVNTIYWNPAGLMQLQEKEATFMHNEWLYDLKYEFLAYCQPTPQGVAGFSLTYLRMGDLEGKDKNENPIGNFGAYDYALSIAYAIPTNENTYVGITGKFIQQKIEAEQANGIAMDIGVLYLEPAIEGLKFAAGLQNIGSKLKFIQQAENLPLTYKLGASYKRNKLLLTGDITKPQDNDTRINLGAEYPMSKILTLRIGYNSKNDLDLGFSFGAGFKLNTLHIDYAFIPYGKLDDTHRFSITKRF